MTETKSGDAATDPVASFFKLLFSFRGRIGRAQYWLGYAFAFASAFFTLLLLAEANRPTGGGEVVLLGFPLAILFLWLHLAVTTKRLRDAGFPASGVALYVLAPIALFIGTMEFFEYIWGLIFAALAVLLAIPGVLPSKPQQAAAAPAN